MNNNFENMSLDNYSNIIKIEQDLLNRKEELKQERMSLITPLYELGRENKNIVDSSLLPDNFEELDTEDLNLRFRIIKSNIRRSSMSERNKNNALDNIDAIERRITRNISALSLTLRSEEKVEKAKKEREIYLEDKRLEIDNLKQEIKQEQEILKKHLTGRTTAIEIGVAQTVIDAYDIAIPEFEDNLNKLRMNLNSLVSEPGLREELDLYMASQNISQNQIDELFERDNNDSLNEELEESIPKARTKVKVVRKNITGESQELEPEKVEEAETSVVEEKEVIEKDSLEELKESILEDSEELEHSNNLSDEEGKESEEQKNDNVLEIGEVQDFTIEEEKEMETPTEEKKEEQQEGKTSEKITTEEEIIPYPFQKSNDTSMYKKKSELNDISDDLVGKWVVKDENDKYINIDNAKEFQPEDAILVLPENAKIDRKNGTYDIPDASQIPNDYKENEFLTEKEEEQFEIVSSHKNWELEQRIKLKKGLRIVLGVAALMATTASIATGAGLLTAVPLGVMANNLIQGIKETPERETVKNSKKLYDETKDFVNNYGYYLPEDVRDNIIDLVKSVKETEELVRSSKNNGTLQLDMVTKLNYLNKELSDVLNDTYKKYYNAETMNSKRR